MGSARTSSVLVRSKSDRRVAFGAVDHAAIAGSNAKAKIFMLFRDNFLRIAEMGLFTTQQFVCDNATSKKDLTGARSGRLAQTL